MRRLAGWLTAAGAILAGSQHPAFAEDVTGYVELSTTSSDAESEIAGTPRTETDTLSYRRRVNFLWNRRLFPNFQTQFGVFYERFDDTIEENGFDRDSDRSLFRPFARLTLRSERVLGEIGADRNEETFRTGDLAKLRLTRDTLLGVFGWYPVELPSVRLELSRVEDRDGDRMIEDRTESAVRLISEYVPVESTRLYYRGSLEEIDDRIDGSAFRTITHNGQVNYADSFFDGRWELGGSWNTTYRNTRVESAGIGEVLIPVPPVGGLFALDDTPDEGLLGTLAELADTNTLVGTAVNLGLVPPAGDDRPRNFGVDLGIARDVNLLRVWVDRDLPFEIASTFSWEVWTSADARFWSRAAVLPTAPFGPFDLRFELRFPNVMARYLKVVARPLAPTVPDASTYPTILVTELEPISAQSAGEFQQEQSSTRNLAQASSRFRILRSPGLYYETTYFLIESDLGPTSWTLSNGLSAQHRFDEVWGVTARVAREDGLDRDRDRTAYVYSAALSVNPLETLSHSLVVSGYAEETGEFTSENHGVYLSSTALVYHGVDMNLVFGKSYSETIEGYTSDSLQIGGGATITPHRTVTFTLRYDDRDSTISRGTAPDVEDRTRSGEAGVAYSPLPSLYFYASRLQEERTTELDRTTDSFAASWAPFPGGALQVSVSYNETRYSDLDETTKTFTPFVRWNVNPRSYLEFAYQALRRESTIQRQEHDILTATLRFGF